MTGNIQKTRQGLQGPKTYEAIAPSKFNISNIDELIKFIQETESFCKRHKIDFFES